MAAIRRAEATWSGALTNGSGMVSAMSSGVFAELPVSWAARTESSDGKTSPEELLAAAHAACFSMALSGALGRAGTPPERLDVSAEVTFDKVDAGWRVVSSALTVRGWVPGAIEGGLRGRGRGGPRRVPDQRRAGRQREAQRRGDARGLSPLATGGTIYPIVRSRRGFATVIVSISASDTPASRSRGRNVSVR